MKNSRFLIAILLFAVTNIYGQPYYFRHYQVENGLSHNTVMCSIQDKKGFLWFGTKDGLNRFDGYSFKIFRNDPADPKSIGGDLICSMYEDHTGMIWIGSDKGLCRYNPVTENFILFSSITPNEVVDIDMDSAGNLWLVSRFTLFKYHVKTGKLKTYPSVPATSVCITTKGDLWAATISGTIQKYNSGSDSFTALDMFTHSPIPVSRWIEKIYDAGNNTLLIGTGSHGAKLFNTQTLTYTDILTKNGDNTGIFVRDFVKYAPDEYWIATESGIFIYNTRTGKTINLKKQRNDPYSVSDNAIYTLCKDKEGGIWAGTYFGGINYYPRQYAGFKKYFPQYGVNSISGDAVREIRQDQHGNLWVGTEDAGLNKLDAKTGAFTHFNSDNTKKSISHYNVHGLLINGDELWVGTFHHGLDILDMGSGKVLRHYSAATHALKSDFIYSLFKTRSGDIMAATDVGLFVYDKQTDNFSPAKGFPENRFYTTLFEDKQGTIWAGTYSQGLYYYNTVTRKKGSFKYEPGNTSGLSSNRINWMLQDSRGTLWIATESGLCKAGSKPGEFKTYTTKTSFPSNAMFAVLEDGKKNFWISTAKGLVCFSPVTQRLKVYTKVNGLLSDQFNYHSAYKDKQGQMYFGSVKGLVSFYPDEFTDTKFLPPVYITGFQINNRELAVNDGSSLTRSITYANTITLPYNQSSFSIDFAALSYTAPEMTEYAYKMQGLDNNWTYLKTNRKAYFTSLAPGSYTFRVMASNNGTWQGKATALTIEILPPVWASNWAYILYAVIAISAGYFIIRHYHKRTEERHRHEKEKEIYQAKIEFFTNVAHEIRTPLTLIKGPLDMVIEKSGEVPAIKKNLEVMEKNTDLLLNLTNQLLDFRKIEINGFSLSFVKTDIAALIKDNYIRFKTVAEQKKLKFTVKVPDDARAYVDAEAVNKIISNLFDNAVKYAKSKVYVCLNPFNDEAQTFTILVKNDGHIIPYELKDRIFDTFFRLKETARQTGTGIGLSMARSLARLHNGSLELSEPENDLNVFALTLPVHQEVEFAAKLQLHNNVTEDSDTVNTPAAKSLILLVDDNDDILEFITANLNGQYHTIKARNGRDALKILNEELVQLVISDVMMPVMDGLELCRNIKSNIEHSHIPVILLTAKNMLQSKIEGLEFGADAYIEKPFSPRHLQAQIANLLTNRNKIKEYFAASPLVHIKTMAYSKADEEFLKKLNDIIYKNLTNYNLDVEHLVDFMNMSRTSLYRKIKAISNLSPHELINIARLKRAAELLVESDLRIYEIVDLVGYGSVAQLRRNFIKQFGMSPSDYASTHKAKEKIDP